MAKIIFGPLISDARGSAGNTVFSRNHAGSYTRPRTIPSQTPTPRRVASKTLMQNLGTLWQGISREEHEAWRTFAELTTYKDSLGQEFTLTGHNMFMKLNSLLDTVGHLPLHGPPVSLFARDPGPIRWFQAGMTADSLLLQVSNLPQASDRVQVWSTIGLNPGRTFFRNYLRLVATPAGNPPWDVGAAYYARFGHPLNPSNLGVRVRYINTTSGAPGPWRSLLSSLLPPPMNFADAEVPTGAINGVNTTYVLAHTPNPPLSLALYLNGLFQEQGIDYTLIVATVTMMAAPVAGDTLVCYYRY